MHITVCICTRNRGASIAATLQSLAASSYTDFDVLVVDQSTQDDTFQAFQAVAQEDARFSYLRSATVGLSVARNRAIGQARGPLIAFTDDDCEVSPAWLERLVAHFEQNPQVGEVCGMVQAVPYDGRAGYVPAYHVELREEVSSRWQLWRARGMGANMAFRKAALQRVGPFDEVLGAGSPLYSGEDADMKYRMLQAGYHILNVPDAVVLHSGFRAWDKQGKLYVRRGYLAVGAVYMKYLRLGVGAMLPAMLHFVLFESVAWGNLLTFRWKRHLGIWALLAYLQGLGISFRYKIDRQRWVYLPNKQQKNAVMNQIEPIAPLSH